VGEWGDACRAAKARFGFDVLIPELKEMKRVGDKQEQQLDSIRSLCEDYGDELHPAQLKRPEGVFYLKLMAVLNR